MTDSPYQEVPGTPYLNHWTVYGDSQSPAAVVPSGAEDSSRYEDGIFSVRNTLGTPRRYSSPFVVPRNSPWMAGTPRQISSLSHGSSARPPRNVALSGEQIVPSTPKQQQQVLHQHTFGTPKSTPRRPVHRQHVTRGTSIKPRSGHEGPSTEEHTPSNCIAVGPSGDHCRGTPPQHEGKQRKRVALQRKLISTRASPSSVTHDILDDIQVPDL